MIWQPCILNTKNHSVCSCVCINMIVGNNITILGMYVCIYGTMLATLIDIINLDIIFWQEQIPFAVVGSREEIVAGGQRIRARKYPWGVVEG